MKILQKKIVRPQYIRSLCISIPLIFITANFQHLLQTHLKRVSISPIGLLVLQRLQVTMFFCLHSNPIKAICLINVYEKISPQRRYKQLSFFEWCFEGEENKYSYNQDMATAFHGNQKEVNKDGTR